jgi:hypothetical protein
MYGEGYGKTCRTLGTQGDIYGPGAGFYPYANDKILSCILFPDGSEELQASVCGEKYGEEKGTEMLFFQEIGKIVFL